MGAFSATMAVALGANIIEKHFCISRTIKNPDSTFSMEPNEFKSMVKQVREVEKAIGKVKYGVSKQEEDNICFRRSLFVVQDIAEGEELTPNNIRSIRPAYGLKPKYYKEVVGKKAAHDLKRGTPLAYADVVHLSLREATYEDMDLLFQWVNDKEVRSNSFNTNIISYESHVNWFNNVMLDHSALQLIMCSDEKPIGQIRLNIDDNNNACISYSISPDKRGLGLGTEMIKLLKVKLVADHYQFKSIIGHVKYENKASQKCFEKCGFIKTDNKNYIEYKLLIE
jgi:RimJ/RimL family protein N-acetyltransferase